MDRTKRSEKEEFWRLLIGEQQTSGLTARAFCKRDGISESQFYAWRSKIAAREIGPPEVDSPPQLIPVAIAGAGHAPVLPVSGNRQDVSHQIEVQTPGGFVVRFSGGIAADYLDGLLSVVVNVERNQRFKLGAERC